MGGQAYAVVVNFHAGAVLGDCLQRLLACPELNGLGLVDNGSAPGEIDRLCSALNDRRIRRLDLPENPGFAVACNRGASLAGTAWLLFVNPDCLVEPDTLRQLLAVANQDSSIAILGVQLVGEDGHPEPASMRRDPLPRRAIVSALGLDYWLGWEGVTMAPMTDSGPVSCDAISGALMLVRRDAFKAVRGFDEGYFLHGEDLDLCRRVRDHGYRVACDPRVRVVHVKGVSSRRTPLRVAYAKHRGLLRYFNKFDAPTTAWPWRVLIHLGAWVRFVMALVRALLPRSP